MPQTPLQVPGDLQSLLNKHCRERSGQVKVALRLKEVSSVAEAPGLADASMAFLWQRAMGLEQQPMDHRLCLFNIDCA